MATYYVLTAEDQDALKTVMVEEGEFTDASSPSDYFRLSAKNIENHGTVEIDGEAVDMLPNTMSDP